MDTPGRRKLEVTYPPELLSEPILYTLITEFQIVVNVLEARVTSEEAWFVIEVEGPARDAAVREIEAWRNASCFAFPVDRFRERFVYDHWQSFSAGNKAWAYFVP